MLIKMLKIIFFQFYFYTIINCAGRLPFTPSSQKMLDKSFLNNEAFYSTPEIVYVEIYCVFDKDIYELHDNSAESAVNYYRSFFKTVDNYFQLLKEPNVRINLYEISHMTEKNSNQNASINDNSYKNEINVDKILREISKYIYNKKKKLRQDIFIVFTPSNLYTFKNSKKHYVTGKTFASGACSIDHEQQLVKSVAVVQDDGLTYKGIRKTISLIGELLGAVEDGSPGAESCDSNDGFIMSSRNTFDAPFTFSWSNCSIKSIRKFLNEKPSSSTSNSSQIKFNNPTCLFNKPHNLKINLTSHWLPGQALSLNDYCKKLTGNYGVCYQYRVSPCTHILCRNTYGQCTDINWGPALEGSWCNTNKRCFYGECVLST